MNFVILHKVFEIRNFAFSIEWIFIFKWYQAYDEPPLLKRWNVCDSLSNAFHRFQRVGCFKSPIKFDMITSNSINYFCLVSSIEIPLMVFVSLRSCLFQSDWPMNLVHIVCSTDDTWLMMGIASPISKIKTNSSRHINVNAIQASQQ